MIKPNDAAPAAAAQPAQRFASDEVVIFSSFQ
jgi:hypothetical protein